MERGSLGPNLVFCRNLTDALFELKRNSKNTGAFIIGQRRRMLEAGTGRSAREALSI
jgi:hypothetical protein